MKEAEQHQEADEPQQITWAASHLNESINIDLFDWADRITYQWSMTCRSSGHSMLADRMHTVYYTQSEVSKSIYYMVCHLQSIRSAVHTLK